MSSTAIRSPGGPLRGPGAPAPRSAAAAAFRAPLVGPHLDLLGGAARHLGEIELERHLEVLTAVLLLAAAPAAPSKQGVEAAQAAEVPHEHIQRLGEVEVREPEVAPPGPAPQPGRAVAVIGGALLGIAQPLVRLG